ncbi:MAG: hypothetical protein VB092_08045 [Oscillospiraceae bacterium]|nr:hypothetical protein [Oscillospiraceae bacterium]
MSVLFSDLTEKFSSYIKAFNENDEELYKQCITNAEAEDFLKGQIPLIDCPDKDIERIYYFRWWTFRKHFKVTEAGHIVTEFLPSVKWAGPYNSIVCPACFHIREGRWLRDGEQWIKQYIDFWLEGKGDALAYSSWLAQAVLDFCAIKNDYKYAVEKLPSLLRFFKKREAIHKKQCGLYWSNDGRDGMEYSISGSGLRPTLNSYAYADAAAISKIAELAGEKQLSEEYRKKAADLKERIDELLWDKEFYKTIPLEKERELEQACRPSVEPERDVKELLGYIPWYFDIPDNDKSTAFMELLKENGFKAPFGLTTAERRHPRFMEEHPHECLWNGPVWPFATSQTLVAAANLLRDYSQDVLDKNDYCEMLRQYARSHRLVKQDGSDVPWIDENMHPFAGSWLARELLKADNWEERKGGYERGKDYNHSLFCDLVLSGLFGIDVEDGTYVANPLIPDNWEYFRVENLYLNGERYSVIYDKTGDRYGLGAGLAISRVD